MPLHGETIAKIKARLTAWLNAASSATGISDLPLDYLNRAKQWLESYQWSCDPLITTYSLTVSDNEAVCPSDLKTILEVYSDPTITGYPDIQFYENHNEVSQRYTKYYTHDNANGGYWTIVFPSVSPLLNAPKLKYVKFLADYTGEDTEYSFFPGELLLKTAQMLVIEDYGSTMADPQIILNAQMKMLKNYEVSIEKNNHVPDLTPKDHWGRPIYIQGYDLSGNGWGGGRTTHFPLTPAQAAGLHGY